MSQGIVPPIKSYACAFCMTGKEEMVARRIEFTFPRIRATPVRQIKRKRLEGQTVLASQVIFPGYIFLEAETVGESIAQLPKESFFSLLTKSDVGWKLTGEDERYAKWVFSIGGLIGMSKAYVEGERVLIDSGPLKDLEGQILRVDKRNQSAQVLLTFNNRAVKAWLGYELIEKRND